MSFFCVPHLVIYILFRFINEPGLGTLIDRFDTIFIQCRMRQDSDLRPFDHKSSLLSTRPDFRLLSHCLFKKFTHFFANTLWMFD
jgi:hypothetical protein